MKLEEEFCSWGAIPCGTVTTGGDRWNVYVLSATRGPRDWCIELAVVGPRWCRVTVRAKAGDSCAMTAQRVLAAVRRWLASGDGRGEIVMDLSGTVVHAA